MRHEVLIIIGSVVKAEAFMLPFPGLHINTSPCLFPFSFSSPLFSVMILLKDILVWTLLKCIFQKQRGTKTIVVRDFQWQDTMKENEQRSKIELQMWRGTFSPKYWFQLYSGKFTTSSRVRQAVVSRTSLSKQSSTESGQRAGIGAWHTFVPFVFKCTCVRLYTCVGLCVCERTCLCV